MTNGNKKENTRFKTFCDTVAANRAITKKRLHIKFRLIVSIIAILFVIIGVQYKKFSTPVKVAVAKISIEQAIERSSGLDVDMDILYSEMSLRDRAVVEQLADKYVNIGIVVECIDYISSAGLNESSIKEAASQVKDKIDSEDIEKIEELYYKYKDKIDINSISAEEVQSYLNQ